VSPVRERLRVLVIHNFYRSANASGENLSVKDEIDGLRRRGWDISFVATSSDSIASGHVSQAAVLVRPTYSFSSARRVRQAVKELRPHVALIENLFPLHSPWVIRVLHDAGVPTAAGVRSYRMSCAAATHFRDGGQCHDCLGTLFKTPAVRHGCYRGSRLATVPIAFSQTVHASTWHLVDRFLAVSDFVGDHLRRIGIDPRRITVRPNFAPDEGTIAVPGTDVLFAGRLTAEKGIGLLLEAWERSGARRNEALLVAGTGPLDHLVRAVPSSGRVVALGLLDRPAMLDAIRACRIVVMPSIWDEPFGRVVIEAASLGRAALVTDRGALPVLVEDGVTGWVSAADPAAMARALDTATDPGESQRRGRAARARYERFYTEERSLDVLDTALRELATSVS
jgi:glycosyltransferase involved in cell wall biosynthesis